jgi:hypothetical protein
LKKLKLRSFVYKHVSLKEGRAVHFIVRELGMK